MKDNIFQNIHLHSLFPPFYRSDTKSDTQTGKKGNLFMCWDS